MTPKPIGKKIIARALIVPKTKEGIILDYCFDAGYKSKNLPKFAKVVSVGNDVLCCKPNDIIMMPIGEGVMKGFRYNEIQYTSIDEKDVWARYEGDIEKLGLKDPDYQEDLPEIKDNLGNVYGI